MTKKITVKPCDPLAKWIQDYEATQRVALRRFYVGFACGKSLDDTHAWVAVECLPLPFECEEVASIQLLPGVTRGEFDISARWEIVSAERQRRYQYNIRQLMLFPAALPYHAVMPSIEKALETLASGFRAETRKRERLPPLSLFLEAAQPEQQISELSRALFDAWGKDIYGRDTAALFTVTFDPNSPHSVDQRTHRVTTTEGYLLNRLRRLAEQGSIITSQAVSGQVIAEWLANAQGLVTLELDASHAAKQTQRSGEIVRALSLACMIQPITYPTLACRS